MVESDSLKFVLSWTNITFFIVAQITTLHSQVKRSFEWSPQRFFYRSFSQI